MALIRFMILALFVPLAHAQPAKLYDCSPFVKGGRGTYYVEPIVQVGQKAVHFAWACQDAKTDQVRKFHYFCALSSCNPVQFSRSMWLIGTGQSTAAKEWAAHSTIITPVDKTSPHYPIALEAQEVLNQLQTRINAKEAE